MPRVKFLFVDDLEANLKALEALLRQNDLEIFKARSGREALDLLLMHEFALAIIDVQMPGMDGFELAELMRGTERTRTIPIIFVTAGIHDERRVFKGYEAGAVDFLHKPLDPHTVKNKVRVFFELGRRKLLLDYQLQQLSLINHELEQFTNVVSHDLKEPLRTVSTYLQLIQLRSPAMDEECQSFIQEAVTAAKRMSGLIDGLLDYARLGGRSPELRGIDLNETLKATLANLKSAVESSQAQILAEPLPRVRADAFQMLQLFQNLIGNALKFRKEEGATTVQIHATEQKGQWQVCVADDGIGFSGEESQRIFDVFHRLHRREQYPGSGIGLAVCKKIVEAHGGTIWAESEPGKGSKFYFTLHGA